MSRGLSGILLAAFGDNHVITIVLIELDFSSGMQRYHSGVGVISYGGNDYTGVGSFGNIEPIVEDNGVKMKGIRVSLQGVDTTVADLSVNEAIQGRSAVIHMAAYDYDTAGVTDAFEIFSGYMDTMELTRGTSATMTLSIESIMTQFDLPNIRRFSSEDHKERYPTDEFFDLMPVINEAEISWGNNTAGSMGYGPIDDDSSIPTIER